MMDVFAYCTQAAREAVKNALGVDPVTSPPTGDLDPAQLAGHDLIYIRLHGIDGLPDVWFGEGDDGNQIEALTAETVRRSNVGGAVVVIASCNGADSEFPEAFYAAGASAVIAGSGPNYAAAQRVIGADLLARYILNLMEAGIGTKKALFLSKARLALSSYRAADADAMKFKLMEKREKR
jgi:hypothetical protein